MHALMRLIFASAGGALNGGWLEPKNVLQACVSFSRVLMAAPAFKGAGPRCESSLLTEACNGISIYHVMVYPYTM